ncbi:hypothetical protein BD560DRAFT_384761 [Blakeslea trispora]|nr:hypothetical protein BD560DRAFT_384761 [Blakeslea trispora]
MYNMRVRTQPVDGCFLCRQRGHVRKDCPTLKKATPSSGGESSKDKPAEEPASVSGVKRSLPAGEDKYAGLTTKQKRNVRRAERRAVKRKKSKKDKMDVDPLEPSEDPTQKEDNEGGETTGDPSG